MHKKKRQKKNRMIYFTFSEVALEPTSNMAKVPHPTSSSCLPPDRLHTPVIWNRLKHNKLVKKNLKTTPCKKTKKAQERARLMRSKRAHIFWYGLRENRRRRIGSSADGSCGDRTGRRGCESCSFSYRSFLFLFPVAYRYSIRLIHKPTHV